MVCGQNMGGNPRSPKSLLNVSPLKTPPPFQSELKGQLFCLVHASLPEKRKDRAQIRQQKTPAYSFWAAFSFRSIDSMCNPKSLKRGQYFLASMKLCKGAAFFLLLLLRDDTRDEKAHTHINLRCEKKKKEAPAAGSQTRKRKKRRRHGYKFRHGSLNGGKKSTRDKLIVWRGASFLFVGVNVGKGAEKRRQILEINGGAAAPSF